MPEYNLPDPPSHPYSRPRTVILPSTVEHVSHTTHTRLCLVRQDGRASVNDLVTGRFLDPKGRLETFGFPSHCIRLL